MSQASDQTPDLTPDLTPDPAFDLTPDLTPDPASDLTPDLTSDPANDRSNDQLKDPGQDLSNHRSKKQRDHMTQRDQQFLYEGKAKRIYRTADPQILVCQFKDDATAFNAQKRGMISGKGEVNCTITAQLFPYLEQHGIPTHFIAQISPTEMQIKAVQILPLEVIVRNRAAGSLCKRLGIERGQMIDPSLVEFCYKQDALGDPLVTLDHIRILNLASPTQVEELRSRALQINLLLQNLLRDANLELIDFKLEFGLELDPAGQPTDRILLADEISPDTCRLWDLQAQAESQQVFDKDLFRFDLGDPVAGYQEVLQRILQCFQAGVST